MAVERFTADDAGCYVDGHWGQYGTARVVEIAADLGYDDAEVIDIAARHLAAMGPSDEEGISDDEHEILSDAADELDAWLNENVACEGYSFGWHDGEYFFEPDEWWEEEAY